MDISYMKDFVIASSFGIIIALDIFGMTCIIKWMVKGIIKGAKFIKEKLGKKKEANEETENKNA